MDDFIDTCVIISSFDTKDKYYDATKIFLEGSQNIVISIYQDKEEIPNLFSRKQKLFLEAIKFSRNPSYIIDYSGFTDRDRILLKTLLTKIRLKEENEETLNKMLEEVMDLRRKILHFIQKRVSKKVIPIAEIEEELVTLIKRRNQNNADSKIIASAIQEHQRENLIAFTLDKKDWKLHSLKNDIESLGYNCPEVRFLR